MSKCSLFILNLTITIVVIAFERLSERTVFGFKKQASAFSRRLTGEIRANFVELFHLNFVLDLRILGDFYRSALDCSVSIEICFAQSIETID